MIDEQSSASGHDYTSDRSAIGAGHVASVIILLFRMLLGLNKCSSPVLFLPVAG